MKKASIKTRGLRSLLSAEFLTPLYYRVKLVCKVLVFKVDLRLLWQNALFYLLADILGIQTRNMLF